MQLGCEPLCQFTTRLYFTTFPGTTPLSSAVNEEAQRAQPPKIRSRSRGTQPSPADDIAQYHYFTIDDDLSYLSFFEDWGPFNIAMIYRACIYIHDLTEDDSLKGYRLVLYSSDDPRRKANAALMMALYVLIVLHRPPWEAFYPIAETEFMPFRDAGRGRSDFNLTIHDCLWGFWKAQRNNLINMNDFSLQEYEYYEKVENGDWNWITPHFVAFASPSDSVWIRQQRDQASGITADSPGKLSTTSFKRKLPQPFQNSLDYFEERNVKLVVRLNNQLYDRNMFLERGIDHLELYFDDGTNPSDEIVREFIDRCEAVFETGASIAIHCKAGLGRTGCLIGAYLIYKYDFTANEAIAFMRICRPGCVVGPQQQFLYERQMDWVRMAAQDTIKREAAALAAQAPPAPIPRPVTPPQDDIVPPTTPTRPLLASTDSTAEVESMLPPGQPRKTPTGKRIALEMLGEDEEDEGAASDDSMEDVKTNTNPSPRRLPVTKQLRSMSPSGKTVVKTPTAIAGSPTKIGKIAAPKLGPAPTTTTTTARVTRVSPRIQELANAKKTADTNGTTNSAKPSAASSLPTRRAKEEPTPTTRTRSGTTVSQSATKPATRLPSRIPGRKLTRAASPPPTLSASGATKTPASGSGTKLLSRLPTLASGGGKRGLGPGKSHTLATALPTLKSTGLAPVKEADTLTDAGSDSGTTVKSASGAVAPTTTAAEDTTEGDGEKKDDAWMSGVDALAAVDPGTSGSRRPSIQRVKRRRSSFSSVDINV
ncbi:phosphatases II [Clavulina sp. PMI_390]|nr:phosphatases II [Clavulina sp. PMI_390]